MTFHLFMKVFAIWFCFSTVAYLVVGLIVGLILVYIEFH